MRSPLQTLVLVVSLAATSVLGTDGPPDASRLKPAAEIELRALVDLVAEELGLNLEYDPNDLTGTVTLRSPQGLEPSALWHAVNDLLASRGLTTIRRSSSGVFRVVKSTEAAALVEPTAPPGKGHLSVDEGLVRAGYVAVLLPLRHIEGNEAERLAKLQLSRAGSLNVGPGEHQLMIADYTERVDRIVAALLAADQPAERVIMREIEAFELSPAELAEAVVELAERRSKATGETMRGEVGSSPSGNGILVMAPEAELATWEELAKLADQRERTETRTYGIEYDSVSSAAGLVEAILRDSDAETGSVVADELTGSLIVTATPGQHERVAEIVERLNTRGPESRRVIRVFPVRNRSVQEVTQLLSQLVSAGVLVSNPSGDGGSSQVNSIGIDETAVGSSYAGERRSRVNGSISGLDGRSDSNDPEGEEQAAGVVLTADASTNRIIAVGEPKLLDELEPLIAELDVRQPQVMLEVIIVSLNEGLSHDLGVELERITIDGSTVLRLSSLFSLGSVDPLDGTAPGRSGIGFTGSVLSPKEYSIVVRALETVSDGRTLSRPRVLVGNNQQATFNSVLQEPFASVNASDTVATTSFGGTQDAGTNISIRPQIAEADHIVLDYSVSLSSFVGESSTANLPPPRQQNSVQSAVTIPDGHAVVVGGIEVTTMGDAESRVPGIGGLPLLGELFKSRSRSNSRSRFYVFIRADVLRRDSFDSLRAISEQSLLEAVVDDGWPIVEPEIMR
jgi:general secretion pathway protein D